MAKLIEVHRANRLLVAERELDPELRAKGGAADPAQQTLMETVAEFLGRLRQILLNYLAGFARRLRHTATRRLADEVSPSAGPAGEDPVPEYAADAPGPLQQRNAHEQTRRVGAAMARLPDEYRRVLQMRYHEGLSFEEIGPSLNGSANAAHKL